MLTDIFVNIYHTYKYIYQQIEKKMKNETTITAFPFFSGVALIHEFSHLQYGLHDESTFKQGGNNCEVNF